MAKRRIGLIKIKSKDIFKDDTARILSIMMFVPLRVELMYGGYYEMHGLSFMFDELEDGYMAPEYVIEVDKEEIGHISGVDGDIINVSVNKI